MWFVSKKILEYHCGKLFARSGIAGFWGMNVQLYKMIPNCFLKWLYRLILWQAVLSICILWLAVCKSYSWSVFSAILITFRLLNIYQSDGYEMVCIVVLICISWLLMSLSIFSFVCEPSVLFVHKKIPRHIFYPFFCWGVF